MHEARMVRSLSLTLTDRFDGPRNNDCIASRGATDLAGGEQ
jgi:hypothetical protein